MTVPIVVKTNTKQCQIRFSNAWIGEHFFQFAGIQRIIRIDEQYVLSAGEMETCIAGGGYSCVFLVQNTNLRMIQGQ